MYSRCIPGRLLALLAPIVLTQLDNRDWMLRHTPFQVDLSKMPSSGVVILYD